MLILTIRTDKPEAEIGLYKNTEQISYVKWQAHRQLAETLHIQIKNMLDEASLDLDQLQGIAVYQGPGSFTGLRIGISVANALASSLGASIVGKMNEDWLSQAISELLEGRDHKLVLPEYGAPVHITQQKK